MEIPRGRQSSYINLAKRRIIMRNIYIPLLVALFSLVLFSCEKPDTPVAPEGYSEIRRIELPVHIERMAEGEMVLHFIDKATQKSDNMAIEHKLEGGKSVITLSGNLRIGEYLLVKTERNLTKAVDEVEETPLGCSVTVGRSSASVFPQSYNSNMGAFGSGTEDDPYRISAATGLVVLGLALENGNSFEGIYLEQQCDIDMVRYYNKGLDPIAHSKQTPFKGNYDGGGYAIKNYAVRYVDKTGVPTGAELPAGLFGYVCGATFRNVTMLNPQIYGGTSSGAIVGVAVGVEGVEQTPTYFYNCRVKRSNEVAEVHGSNFVGGLIGGADMQATVVMKNCVNEGLPVGNFEEGSFVGGLFGGGTMGSMAILDSLVNRAPITSSGSRCVGGILGGSAQAAITNCINYGSVDGRSALGTGGIAGGLGNSIISAVINEGLVCGNEGTGGIVGSTVLHKGEGLYNDITISSAHNYGDVIGIENTGGLVGEAQALITDGYNRGTVRGTGRYTGGLCGFTPVVSLNSCYNAGNVQGSNYGAGMVSRSDFYVIANCNNLGRIEAVGTAAGILGFGGSVGAVNFCNNFGLVESDGRAGGIVGLVGTKDDISFMDGASIAVSAGIFGYSLISFIVTGGQTGPKGFIAKAMDGWHVISLLLDAGTMIKAIATPGMHLDLDKWDSLYSSEIGQSNELMREKMLSEINTIIPTEDGVLKNSGIIPSVLVSGTEEFYKALSADGCYEYTKSVHKRLAELDQSVSEVQKNREIALSVVGCILAAGTLASGFVTGGAALGLATAALEVALSLTTELTENDSNAIEITQCCNTGGVSAGNNGYGIASKIGDFTQLYYCLSSGKTSGYGITNRQNGSGVEVYSNIACGVVGQDPYPGDWDSTVLLGSLDDSDSDKTTPSNLANRYWASSALGTSFEMKYWSLDRQYPKVVPLPHNNIYYNYLNMSY